MKVRDGPLQGLITIVVTMRRFRDFQTHSPRPWEFMGLTGWLALLGRLAGGRGGGGGPGVGAGGASAVVGGRGRHRQLQG